MHRRTPVEPSVRPTRARRGWAVLTIALAVSLAAALAPGVASPAAAASPPDQWTGVYGSAGSSSTNTGEHVLTAGNAGKITQAFAATNRTGGSYPPVVLGGVVYTVGGTTSPRFYASSPRTGKALWSMALPYAVSSYGYGMTGTGSTVLISFGTSPAGGVLVVDVAKHAITARAFLPKATTPGADRTYPGTPTTDGTRVFLFGSGYPVLAFSVKSGKLLWKHSYTPNNNDGIDFVYGFAVGGGTFYTSGGEGLVAYSATTGRKKWTSDPAFSYGTPVLAGGRVFVNVSDAVAAFPAAGCGAASCKPLWSTAVDSYDSDIIGIAGADSTNLFITYRTSHEPDPTKCEARFAGHIARLSASTGTVKWQTEVGDFAQGMVRGGDVVWIVNEYGEFQNGTCVGDQYRLLAYSTTATATAPLAALPIDSAYFYYPQTLAVASGTVFQSPNSSTLVGYRVPGT
ncbi:putative pyrroloquinoline-quinone binding quinoprotein [Frondihabitans sp. PhB188]|uniref:outer membrane protein assembly factor BamB family protein n=1 Tax=Frondihabitans sp. PhB188 TaxID=2485200 RepID=UPI000F48A7C3|nr:PQQ-binding-like beta-propeller repeat protein [Frondihabitans sp. PhB188]ROQ39697.1 putative pyrroloquinoline-quinone binding quinoprotein [Frondihabitans sp. PhB188]